MIKQKQQKEQYAIQIRMIGDVGKRFVDIFTVFYLDKGLDLDFVTSTQDFSAVNTTTKPTLFTDKQNVIKRAKEVQSACTRIQNRLLKDGIWNT